MRKWHQSDLSLVSKIGELRCTYARCTMDFIDHQVTLLCFYEEVKEATLAGEKRPVIVALREAQLWLRSATLTDILGRVQVIFSHNTC